LASITGKLLTVAAAALVSAAVLIPAAASARTHYKVQVSIRYGADSVLRGKVSSPKGRCKKGVKVVVVNLRTSAVVGAAFADKHGKWKLPAPGLVDLVNASVGRSGTSLESGVSFVCNRAVSPTIAPVDV
jgi:hypothetical protein